MSDIKKDEIVNFQHWRQVANFIEISKTFKIHKKLFPHIRTDYITRMIVDNKCIFEDGIVIIYNQYKRNNTIGTVMAPKGSFTIKQIANANPGNGSAEKVLNKFVEFANADIYLSVRADNKRAIRFYERTGFNQVGTIDWSRGTIPGCVFLRKK